jgi:cytidine deaminase
MKDLYKIAKEVLPNSYSEYSKFKVAAVLRMKDGTTISGVNVENASFGLTNCAERTALFTAYSQGYRKDDIVEVLLTTEQDAFISPCGACRQVLRELVNEDVNIHITNNKGEVKTVKNIELLPFAFTEKDL